MTTEKTSPLRLKVGREAVGSGTDGGTVVSIGKPAGTPSQKWVITPKGNNLYSNNTPRTPIHGSKL